MFFTPIQQMALAGLMYHKNKIAIEQLKTLKKIEEENREALERTRAQGLETGQKFKIGLKKLKPDENWQHDTDRLDEHLEWQFGRAFDAPHHGCRPASRSQLYPDFARIDPETPV